MLLALTHILHLCLRVMSPVVEFYLLSFNPLALESDFPFLNYKANQSYYFFSYTISSGPLSEIGTADFDEERLRCGLAELKSIPAHTLNDPALIHISDAESLFSKNTNSFSVEAGVLLWLFAVH
jgi:hypothetical protein